ATDALFSGTGPLVVPDTGTLVGDLRDFIGPQIRQMVHPAYVRGIPGLTVELLRDREAFQATFRRYIKPAEDGYAVILERARDRGEVTDPVDPRLVTYVVSGLTTSLSQGLRLSARAITDRVVAALVGGIVPT
ncbi:MAG: TetR-like C-terminal domain-containing protein, partial [Acidimicrobiia bacterium]